MRCLSCGQEVNDGMTFCTNCGNPISSGAAVLNTISTKKAPGFFESYKLMWKNYANFNGRARRSEFWFAMLFHFIMFIIGTILVTILGVAADIKYQMLILIVFGIYYIVMLIPVLSLATRRLHDSGHTGKWIAVPYVCAALILILSFSAMSERRYAEIERLSIIILLLDLIIFGTNIATFVMTLLDTEKGINKYGNDPKYIEIATVPSNDGSGQMQIQVKAAISTSRPVSAARPSAAQNTQPSAVPEPQNTETNNSYEIDDNGTPVDKNSFEWFKNHKG